MIKYDWVFQELCLNGHSDDGDDNNEVAVMAATESDISKMILEKLNDTDDCILDFDSAESAENQPLKLSEMKQLGLLKLTDEQFDRLKPAAVRLLLRVAITENNHKKTKK